MKSFIDNEGKIAWIYDEKKVEVKKPVIEIEDLNGDGKVDKEDFSIASKVLSKAKKVIKK